ncbi:MAG: FtsX-like permease family protein [Bacteroidota bacterium]
MSASPKIAQQLLRWFAGRADLEDILGDINEVYLCNLKDAKKWQADLNYWRQVCSLLFSYGLKKRKRSAAYAPYYSKNSIAMFKNYFKIAIRNFAKHKLFATLNIFGLALGMSVCLIALTMTVTVHLMDEFHHKKARIHQINTSFKGEANKTTYSSTFPATSDYLKQNYPFVEAIVDIQSGFKPVVDHHGQLLDFSGYFAGEAFFNVFSFNLIQGNSDAVLKDPFSMVLTEKTAKKLFGDGNALGKTIKTDLGIFNVTGVMEDLHQTHFFFEMLTSYETYKKLTVKDLKNDWVNFRNHYAYTLLHEGTKTSQLAAALTETAEIANAYHPDEGIDLQFTEVSNIVPHRWNNTNALGVGWEEKALVFFIAIGILILTPSIFNHVNLSIARSLKRAREIGIRKVMGVQKRQIKTQFIIETMLIALLALIVSFFIMVPMKEFLLEMVYFSEVVDTDLNSYQVLVFVGFALLVGLIAGIFPAQYFARLNPVQTLKGEVLNGKNKVAGYKKGLFVFQFFMSLVFVIGVAAIGKQYRFVLNNNHGFESNNVLSVPFSDIEKQILMNELGKHPHVKAVTASSNLPGLRSPERIQVSSNGIDSIDVMQVYVADNFVEQMQMELIWGESKAISLSNQNEELVLVNQQLIQSLKVFHRQADTLRFTIANGTKCSVVGILKDFNFEPLSELISPLIMRYSLEESNYALVTVNSPNIKRTITDLELIWSNINQNRTFEASFLDDEIEEAYFIFVAQLKFFSVLSILAITISCLGLLGMVSYTTENRTKEIAVRKIMGATKARLFYLLTKDFLKLIAISALLAIPFSYFFYDKIFLHFLIRYGTGLGVIEVVISILFLFMVGTASIYWQTAKVTKANPATKLRYQ